MRTHITVADRHFKVVLIHQYFRSVNWLLIDDRAQAMQVGGTRILVYPPFTIKASIQHGFGLTFSRLIIWLITISCSKCSGNSLRLFCRLITCGSQLSPCCYNSLRVFVYANFLKWCITSGAVDCVNLFSRWCFWDLIATVRPPLEKAWTN
jgi:hypothetical protein